jgi:hypothetical protein
MAVAEWLAQRQPGEIFNLQGGIEAWSVEVDSKVLRYDRRQIIRHES